MQESAARSLATLSATGSSVLAPPERKRVREVRGLETGDGPPYSGNGGDGNGGGGNGGGGGGGPDEAGAGDPDPTPVGALEVAFGFLLIAICTLFLTFLAASLFLRRSSIDWPPPGTPRVPGGLWWSTLLMLVSSAAMTRSVRILRRGDAPRARRWLGATMALGSAFLFAQGYLWRELITEGLQTSNAYGTIFYSLTGLHAVHVVAGLVYLAIILARLGRAKGTVAARSSATFCGIYWHFMGAIWLVLFAALSTLH